MNIDDVLTGYVECALRSETDQSDESGGEPLDQDTDTRRAYTVNDITSGAHDAMRSDVADFVAGCEAERPNVFEGMDPGQVGHDFWLTRNGHGAGFWDRGLGERGSWLTAQCKPYGEASLYIGDDERLYYAS